MPIYEFGCGNCGCEFEKLVLKPTTKSWREEKRIPIECPECGKIEAYKLASRFKIGSSCLDTTKLTGYDDDELTLGKIVDEGGIPYEFKDGIKKKEKRREEVKEYVKGLKKRGKKYGFDPFSADDENIV